MNDNQVLSENSADRPCFGLDVIMWSIGCCFLFILYHLSLLQSKSGLNLSKNGADVNDVV